ncbi:MAG TPA: hypothetical protein DGT23_14730 [Micromonosporaceae bacterium]|nr:hypothetical protein [Micromonosporaceae bacterium]
MPKLEGFKPLEMSENPPGVPKPRDASSVYLKNPETGEGFWVTHGVTDKADGITDADFNFPPDVD